MTSINVRLADGTQLTIKEGDKYSDLVKDKKLEKLAPLFDVIDNTGGVDGEKVVNGKELDLIKTAIEKMDGNINNYDIDKYCKDILESDNMETFIKTNAPAKKAVVSQDGKTSQKAFNQYILNLGQKYDKAELEKSFNGTTHKISSGDTLYRIAKDALGEGATNRAINDKMAQIAVLNNLKDVNNIKIGTELKIAGNVSTKGTNPSTVPEGKEDPITGKESKIAVSENGVDSSWGNGEDVADHAGVKKYTKGEATKYQAEVDGVKITGATVEEVEAKKKAYEEAAVTAKPAEEADEAATARKAKNLEALRTRIAAADGNVEAIKKAIDELKNPDLTDSTSAEYKALVQELFDTKNPDVIRKLLVNAAKEEILEVVNKNDIAALSKIDISHLNDEEKKEVYTVLANKAVGEFTAEGKAGNLENTKYIEAAFDWIDGSSLSDENKVLTKTQILESYFKVETSKDADGNEVKTYKFEPSRRPTKDEMEKLAERAELSEDMNLALVKSIKLEEMGPNEYNAALEYCMGNRIVPHYAEMVDKMNAEDVLDFIENKATVDRNWNLPYDKIMEKFPNDPKIFATLGKYMDGNSTISDANKLVLAKNFMEIDADGNVKFDPAKLPEGVTTRKILDVMLPKDCTKGEYEKIYRAILATMNQNSGDFLSAINNHTRSEETQKLINEKIRTFVLDTSKSGSDEYNRLALFAYKTGIVDDADMLKVFDASSDKMKANLINSGYTRNGGLVVVKSGDSVDKIVKKYLAAHLDKFPQLQKSVKSDSKKWTPERINVALNDYMQDFRVDIMKELGIDDPTKLKAGQIINLKRVNWSKHQPNWLKYNIFY